MSSMFKARVTASQLVCVSRDPSVMYKVGKDQDSIDIIPNGVMLIANDGTVAAVGTAEEIAAAHPDATFEQNLEFPGKSIIPGLVDAHTHPVWAGDRVNEFRAKLAGATYMDIHAQGGGIGFTVARTAAASEDELLALLLPRLRKALAAGTTLLEAKSGYGLVLDGEMKQLRVIQRARSVQPIELVANYCAAHSVPKGSTAEAATEDIITNQLPAIREARARNEIAPEQIDVFCETGVFTTEQTRRIIEAGAAEGLQANFHGDELTPTGSAEMAAAAGARAVSHLECISEEGISAMAKAAVAAVLLPTTAHVLRLHPPPARALVTAGVPVALGSDFNPNAYCLSMPMAMHLACVQMRLTCPEALVAATLNAAYALGRERTHGSLAQGKRADFVVVGAEVWDHLVYQMGTPPVDAVYKGGERVWEDVTGLAKTL